MWCAVLLFAAENLGAQTDSREQSTAAVPKDAVESRDSTVPPAAVPPVPLSAAKTAMSRPIESNAPLVVPSESGQDVNSPLTRIPPGPDPDPDPASTAVGVERLRAPAQPRFSIDPPVGAERWREKPAWLKAEESARHFVPDDSLGYRLLGRDSVYLIDHLLGVERAAAWFPGTSRDLPRPIAPPRQAPRTHWPTLPSEETNPGGALRPFGRH